MSDIASNALYSLLLGLGLMSQRVNSTLLGRGLMQVLNVIKVFCNKYSHLISITNDLYN